MINYLYDDNGLLKKKASKGQSGVIVSYYLYNKKKKLNEINIVYNYEKDNRQRQCYSYDSHRNIKSVLYDYGDNYKYLYHNEYDENDNFIKQTINFGDDSFALCTFMYKKIIVPEDMIISVKKQQWCIINDMTLE